MIRNQLESSRINAVHSFKHKPCRTAVRLSRASTSFLQAFSEKDVDGRDKPTSVRHSLCLSCRLLHGDGCTRDSTTVRRPRCVRPKIKLRLFWRRRLRWIEKFRDRPPLHQVGPDEPREGERACN